jgi:hypothetical protein
VAIFDSFYSPNTGDENIKLWISKEKQLCHSIVLDAAYLADTFPMLKF